MADIKELEDIGADDVKDSNALHLKGVRFLEGVPRDGFTMRLGKACKLCDAAKVLATELAIYPSNIAFAYEGASLDVSKTVKDNAISDQGAIARKKGLKIEISYMLLNDAMPGDLRRQAEAANAVEAKRLHEKQEAEERRLKKEQEAKEEQERLVLEKQPLWSAMMYIADQDTDFDDFWIFMRPNVFDILHQRGTWMALGFERCEQMEASVRKGVGVWEGDSGRRGAVARALTKAEADKIAKSFQDHGQEVFPCRVELDRAGAEMGKAVRDAGKGNHWNPPAENPENAAPQLKVTVSRELVIKQAVRQILDADAARLRSGPFSVKYEGEEGQGHGVTRSFITHVAGLLADPRFGLLLPAPQGRKMLNPLLSLGQDFVLPPSGLKALDDVAGHSWESLSRFLGRVLGMAVVHKAPTGIVLASSLCKQLLGAEPAFEDLQFVPGMADSSGVGFYSSLRNMLAHRAPAGFIEQEDSMLQMDAEGIDNACLAAEMPSSSRQVAESLADHFELSPEELVEAMGKRKCSSVSAERIKRQCSGVEGDGLAAKADINCGNLLAFAQAMTKKALTDNLKPNLGFVVEEFRRVVPADTLQGLTGDQLREKISGRRLTKKSIDEWQTYTRYKDCGAGDNVVKWWWEYLKELGAEDDPQKLNELFSWCTGFGAMPISWRFQVWGVSAGRLPSVNTCQTVGSGAANHGDPMPTIYLPAYESKQQLIERLELAMTAKGLNKV